MTDIVRPVTLWGGPADGRVFDYMGGMFIEVMRQDDLRYICGSLEENVILRHMETDKYQLAYGRDGELIGVWIPNG